MIDFQAPVPYLLRFSSGRPLILFPTIPLFRSPDYALCFNSSLFSGEPWTTTDIRSRIWIQGSYDGNGYSDIVANTAPESYAWKDRNADNLSVTLLAQLRGAFRRNTFVRVGRTPAGSKAARFELWNWVHLQYEMHAFDDTYMLARCCVHNVRMFLTLPLNLTTKGYVV